MPRMIPVTVAQLTPNSATAIGSGFSPSFSITAHHANAEKILVGDSNVSTTRYMASLSAGEMFSPPLLVGRNGTEEYNLADWYVIGSASGNKANIGYIQRG